MTRRGNNRTTKAQQAERQAKAVELVKEGLKPGEIAEQLGAGRTTIWRDLKSLMKTLSTTNAESFQQLKQEQDAILRKMEELLLTDKVDPEIVREWRAIRKDINELWGLDEARKSITAHVSNEHSREYLLFREAVAGLDESQLQEVYRFAKAIKRTWTPPPIEADFPPPMRALPEATDEAD